MTRKQTMDMTQGKPLGLILRFTVPVFFGNLFQQMYNTVDTIIVGRCLGSNALAAVGSTGTLMGLLLGIANGLTTGFSLEIAQAYGAKDYDNMRRCTANAILLTVILSALLTSSSVLLMNPLLRLMNTPEEIYVDAYRYIIVIGWGASSSVFYNLASAILRAVGNSKVPLYFLIFSSLLNIVLDLLLIAVFDLGTAGASLATVLSQAIAAFFSMLYIKTKIHVLWAGKGEWKLNRKDSFYQLKIGIPMAIQYGVTSSGNMVKQSALNMFGADAIAATSASGKFQMLLTPGMYSMGQTMATWAGQNYGSRDYPRIRRGVKTATQMILVYSLITGGASILLVRPVMSVFFSGEAQIDTLLPFAKTYLNVCVPFYFVLGCIFIYRSVLQGCGSAVLPTVGGFLEFAGRIIISAIAIHFHSYLLACACDPAAWVLCSPVLVLGYFLIMKKLEKGEKSL